jgi:hypothetical protein
LPGWASTYASCIAGIVDIITCVFRWDLTKFWSQTTILPSASYVPRITGMHHHTQPTVSLKQMLPVVVFHVPKYILSIFISDRLIALEIFIDPMKVLNLLSWSFCHSEWSLSYSPFQVHRDSHFHQGSYILVSVRVGVAYVS